MPVLRRRIGYADVVATLALFVALGGTSYAALAITGKQVKNSSLTGRDVKNGSLAGRDVKNGSLTNRDVKKRSLLASSFKAGELPAGRQAPAGPAGPTGATGPAGPAGALSGLRFEEAETASDSAAPKALRQSCPPRMQIIGGGAAIEGPGAANVAFEKTLAEPPGEDSWTARAHEHAATGANWSLRVQAICVDG